MLVSSCSITFVNSHAIAALIQSLVARELKARYRGSVLGFFWSFFNPLLLLLVYTFVFAYVMPPPAGIDNYALFLFCGHPAVDLVLGVAARVVQRADHAAATSSRR